MNVNRRTCTVMVYTDGHTSTYAVMVGPMRGGSFYAHRATTIATYTLTDQEPDYRAMTARHETDSAPAVWWQS